LKNTVVADKIVFPDADFKMLLVDKAVTFDGKGFHEEIEIKYCYEGTFSMLIDMDVYTVQAGDVVIVNPYEIHKNIDIETRLLSFITCKYVLKIKYCPHHS
jgi:mannose-6-phosphate isomerase class I